MQWIGRALLAGRGGERKGIKVWRMTKLLAEEERLKKGGELIGG